MDEIDRYNEEVENYNQAVDNENSLSDEILTEIKGIKDELQRIGNLLSSWMAKQKR